MLKQFGRCWLSIYRLLLVKLIFSTQIKLIYCNLILFNLFQLCTGHVLCSILLNSADLLRVDLQGVQVLLPHLIAALETVLPRKEFQLRCSIRAN